MSDLVINDGWAETLRHMLGAGDHIPLCRRGYRNYFCVGIGGPDHAMLCDMEAAGLVKRGHKINQGRDEYFFATREGCKYIKLGRAATKRAFEP